MQAVLLWYYVIFTKVFFSKRRHFVFCSEEILTHKLNESSRDQVLRQICHFQGQSEELL